MMKILHTVNSPYARKVRIVAMEKHIAVEQQLVVLSAPDCPVKNYNPLGKVPVLVLDDGESLYDSRVIVEYLDNHTPGSHLIPHDNSTKIEVRRWEALADGVCDAAVAVMIEQRKPVALQDESYVSKQMDKVTRGLTVLNSDMKQKTYCVNNTFSLADIALGCLMGYLDLRFNAFNFLLEYPHLGQSYALLMQRKSFQDTAPVAG